MIGCALDPCRELGKDVVAGDARLWVDRVQRGIIRRGQGRLEIVFNFGHVREDLAIEQYKRRIRPWRNVGQFFWFAGLINCRNVKNGSLQPQQHEQALTKGATAQTLAI